MTVREITEALRLAVRAGERSLQAEVGGGIVGDLLSVVMSRASRGDIWVTVQCHPNVVAVAVLAGLAGVVIAHGFEPEPATLAKAEEEGVPLLTTEASSFQVVGQLHEMGVA